MTAGVYEITNIPWPNWDGMVYWRSKTEYRDTPREVLSEFDHRISSISGLSIMKAREFENSKNEG